jgi:hypothetical protein
MVINEALVAAYIYIICSVILTFVGLIGNTWTCYIFTRKKFRKVSMFFYLAVSNISNLLLMLTVWPISLTTEAFKFKSLSFSCKFFSFMMFFLSDLGPCMLLLSSLDRLASVKYSRKFQFRNKLKFQLLAVLVVIILLVILNMPLLITLDLVPFGLNNVTYILCTIDLVDYARMSKYILIKINLVSLFIPFILMILSTILIAHHLIKHKRKLNSSKTKFEKEIRFVRVVLTVDLFYFITNCPTLLKALATGITGIDYSNFWLTVIFDVLLEVYLTADFFLYYWCNKLFRDHVKMIFLCIKRRTKFTVGNVNKDT